MPTCFVMQPFDGSTFDQRYEEVFAPAIRAAGLEPYRVDQDPKVSIPIEDIENGIRQSQICLAEITLDNPNVWFELGFAIACGKEVVLICSDSRTTKFPFDIQHRTIIKYKTGTPSDFERLKENIEQKIVAYIKKAEALGTVSAQVSQLSAPSEGFAEHEVVALAAIAQNLSHTEDHVGMHQIHRDMEASGYTRVAATFAMKTLVTKDFLESTRYTDMDGDAYFGYSLTERGWAWVLANQHRFALEKPAASRKKKTATPNNGAEMDDEIPF